ncbi:Hypothetical protein NTJ_13098 [Nesidiocoris tenuis]|uniref:Uncharacterized protein n=1 Tax=Nesidiocoris tenuis TaxID=355587 RepID=A0ABN7B7B8_9HEMI|nr:Hypothetical protein NTJ_13098 [Nesidiocoris tenuis]
MGQLYSKLNQLVMNDVDTVLDPDYPRQKLETTFTTPARPLLIRLPDPRSATQNIDRTPILVPAAHLPVDGTPKSSKVPLRARYLETDLDDVIGVEQESTEKQNDAIATDKKADTPCETIDNEKPANAPEVHTDDKKNESLLDSFTSSTPCKGNANSRQFDAVDIVESILDEVLDRTNSKSELRFSDTGHIEVMTSDLTLDEKQVSSAEEAVADQKSAEVDEIVITFRDVSGLTEEGSVLEEVSDSLFGNWSGVGGGDRSAGVHCLDLSDRQQLAMSTPARPSPSQTVRSAVDDSELDSPLKRVHVQLNDLLAQEDIALEDDTLSELPPWRHPEVEPTELSDSLIVHRDTSEYGSTSTNDDSLLVSSPEPRTLQESNKNNGLYTPQKIVHTAKLGIRTPLGDVSTNSPIRHQNLAMLAKGDGRPWKNARDVRHKLGLDAENTPPHSSAPPTSVQSAPGKIRSKTAKGAPKWANDSIVI